MADRRIERLYDDHRRYLASAAASLVAFAAEFDAAANQPTTSPFELARSARRLAELAAHAGQLVATLETLRDLQRD